MHAMSNNFKRQFSNATRKSTHVACLDSFLKSTKTEALKSNWHNNALFFTEKVITF